jgi:acetylornithine deacetylase/succinyl-diaminopimelate desuccinylase-like protein
MSTPTTTTSDPLETYFAAGAERRLARFLEFLRIPSVGGMPEHAADTRRAAEVLGAELAEAGLEHVELAETGGHPVVYADWLHAGPDRPTVLVYAHYDVQPGDPVELWETSPFEPVVRDGRVLGRGSSDDKAHVQMLVRVAEALLAVRGALPVNVKLMFEGEEESSSVHLDGWLEANRERLAGDVAMICDTAFFEGNVPSICVGLRGIVYVQVDVEGPAVDLHSGSFGGAVVNPATTLVEMLAALKGPDGRIRIPGFYDDVVALTDQDRAASAALPFDEAAWMAEIGVEAVGGEAGYTNLERRTARPTLDINGIWGGFTGDGPKTIIPAHAHAKVSCRLVADQDPARIFAALRDHVLAMAPLGVRVTVRDLGMGRGTLTPIDHPATQAAARAIEGAFGVAPLYFREGGSIPVAASFERILGQPVVLLGFMNPDSRAHAPNENLVLANFETGLRALVRMFDELADYPRG